MISVLTAKCSSQAETYSGWHKDYDKRNFSIVRYDVDWLDKNFVNNVSQYMGLMYITNGDDSNDRWFDLGIG